MLNLEFGCGCKFPLIDGHPDKIALDLRAEFLNYDCSRTWKLIGEGNTKGVFQLESGLGQSTAKELRPEVVEQLAALIAILRPGCLQAKRDDGDGYKTVTQHYIDRKNGVETVEYFHPALEPILSETFGEMIYQEQAMQIAVEIAGFDPQEADMLRKAIGKKKADVMAKVKTSFLEGCERIDKVTRMQAEEIFGWIEKSQRYSFNKSHAVSYAINAYLTAYLKAHFPEWFFTSWLHFSKDKQKTYEEVKQLVNNAKVMDIDIWPPRFELTHEHFQMVDGQIHYGLVDIKEIGHAEYLKTINQINLVEQLIDKPHKDWNCIEILVYLSQNIKSTVVKGLIESGSLCQNTKMDRSAMLFEFDTYTKLTNKERAWIQQNMSPDLDLKKLLHMAISAPVGRTGSIANKKRAEKVKELSRTLDHPPYAIKDTGEWLANVEEFRLGIPLTVSPIQAYNRDSANCSCRDYIKGEKTKDMLIAVRIDTVREILTKNGKNAGSSMAFISFSDDTGAVDGVAFSEAWKEIASSGVCTEGNGVMLSGCKSRNKSSFIVQKMWQLT